MGKLIHLVALVALTLLGAASAFAQPLKAGLAKVVITPDQPIRLSGYANRNRPSEGKLHDLHAGALALADERGARFVLVTTDLLGFSREVAEPIAERARKQFGLRREQLMLTSSHTHTGPIVRQNLIGAYDLDAAQAAVIAEYARQLQDKIVALIGAALRDLAPARLSFSRGVGDFAKNRRQLSARGTMTIGVNDEGVVDHDVPVLLIESPAGKLRGVVFGYACHNTTLTGEHYQISGDYAGFAQAEWERTHPDATALFVMGCGADINPFPRSTVEHAQRHGTALAAAVTQAMKGARLAVRGKIKTAFDRVLIPFAALPTRAEFEARLNDQNVFKRRHAQRMLQRLDRDGQLSAEYPYPIQVVQLGADFTLLALGGEVVTDYALRLKRELGARGLWVAAYANEVMAYIPSARMFPEGGYEVIDSMIYYDQPTSWAPELEEKIIGKARELARRVGRQAVGGRRR